MGTITVRIKYVTWRDGRPRFSPGPRDRALGYAGEDLRHPDGTWFTLDEAARWSAARAAEIAALRGARKAGGRSPQHGVPASDEAFPRSLRAGQRTAREQRQINSLPTLGELVASWLERDPRMAGRPVTVGRKVRKPRSANTVRYYKGAARLVEQLDGGRFWTEIAAAITADNLATLLDRAEICHGLAQARAVRAMLSVAFRWGLARKMVRANPVAALEDRLPVLQPRQRAASVAEFTAFLAAADSLPGGARPEIGDLAVLGVFTAQRQGDRLAVAALEAGAARFAEAKKGGRAIEIPLNPLARARLKAARARRKADKVQWPHLVIDEVAGRPFASDWYRKVFRQVRDAAVRGILANGELGPEPEKSPGRDRGPADVSAAPSAGQPPQAAHGREDRWIIPPCGSLHDFRDQDWRDTALTWATRAGCTDAEITALSGHAYGGAKSVLKHYVAANDIALARAAVDKVWVWYQAQLAAIGKAAGETGR